MFFVNNNRGFFRQSWVWCSWDEVAFNEKSLGKVFRTWSVWFLWKVNEPTVDVAAEFQTNELLIEIKISANVILYWIKGVWEEFFTWNPFLRSLDFEVFVNLSSWYLYGKKTAKFELGEEIGSKIQSFQDPPPCIVLNLPFIWNNLIIWAFFKQ